MNEHQINEISRALVRLSSEAVELSSEGVRRTKVILEEGVGFALVDCAVDAFDDVTATLLNNNNWEEKFSEQYMEKRVQNLLARITKDKLDFQQTRQYVTALATDLDSYDERWVVYVPAFGVKVLLDSLNLGQVTLYQLTPERIKKLIAEFT